MDSKGDFRFRYAVNSALMSTNWPMTAGLIADGTITFNSFQERLATMDLENRVYLIQKLEEQKPSITGLTRKARLANFINKVKNYSGATTSGGVTPYPNTFDTGAGKPFWGTDFGQFLLDLSGVNSQTNQLPTDQTTDNTNTTYTQPQKNRKKLIWWIGGSVVVLGVIIGGTVLAVRASKKNTNK